MDFRLFNSGPLLCNFAYPYETLQEDIPLKQLQQIYFLLAKPAFFLYIYLIYHRF